MPNRFSPGCKCCGGCSRDIVVTVTNCFGDHPPSATATFVSSESQVIAISGSPTGGTFTLSFQGDTTDPIPWNATAHQVQTALTALPSIGTGNVSCTTAFFGGALPTNPITVTFIGDLGQASQPLLSASTDDGDGGSTLTGGDHPFVSVTETLEGGQTLGPIDLDDDTGQGTFTKVLGGLWTLTVSAPDYIDSTQDVQVDCPPSGLLSIFTGLVVADGKIVLDGKPKPFTPPGSVDLPGLPLPPGGSLSLVSCTRGVATYFAASKPRTGTYICGPPECGQCDPTLEYTKQAFYTASFGCASGLSVVWTFSNNPPHAHLCGDFTRCVPGGAPGNLSCGSCSCAESLLTLFSVDTSRTVSCGEVATLLTSPGVFDIAGGACFTAQGPMCDGRRENVARAGRKTWRPSLPGYLSGGPSSMADGGSSTDACRRRLRASLRR